ncbi:MAG: Asp-tRNA(Asn)/Glu-tRNA(Gln) amidotransferase subunit GatC [Treponema sp.]|nr:Asp-tRNA(Asn)/Glu-tRNA(Gln) amidotransferase subunit GatC [Treponema sp.]
MKDIKEYEAMTKLDLPEEERRLLSGRISRLMDSFSVLEKIDTSGTEPLVTVLDLKNILRDDVAKKIVTRDELLSAAPEEYDGYFQVPRTLE